MGSFFSAREKIRLIVEKSVDILKRKVYIKNRPVVEKR